MGVESAGERYRGTPEARGERGASSSHRGDQPTLQDYRFALANVLYEVAMGDD